MKLSRNTSLTITIVSILVLSYFYLSVLHSHTKLVEDRGVYDDICYLRQAYLFRAQGAIGGLDTDNSSARYGDALLKKVGLDGKLTSIIPCHGYLVATDKYAMQYPPGTGFLLSFFPEGSQASGLYIASSTTIFLMLMWLIATSPSRVAMGILAVLGSLTLYFMVNPAKASYSIAPTMPLCMAVAYLTVKLFSEGSSVTQVILAASAGFLVGVATDIRLSSVLLAFGYAAVFAWRFVQHRTWVTLAQPIAFGVALVAGVIPTFAANVINGGSPFATAYGGVDTAPALTSFDPLLSQVQWYFFSGTHSVITWLSLVLLVALGVVTARRRLTVLQPPLFVAFITLLVDDAYFITHPIQSQYYSVPPAILALWVGVFVLVFWLNNEELISSKPPVRVSAAGVAVTLMAATALLAYDGMFSRPPFERSIAIESNAVVWIGGKDWQDAWKRYGLGLAFQYRFQRHALPGLGTLSSTDQDRVLTAVATDAKPQYIVTDDHRMQAIVSRLERLGTASVAGQAFGADVYRVSTPSLH